MAIDPLDYQKSWQEPAPVQPEPVQQTFVEPIPNAAPPAPPPAPYVPMPTAADPIVMAQNLPEPPPMPVPVTESEKASFLNAARIAARQGVVPADKPYGWARQDKDGNLLYVTPDGEKRWVPPEEVYLAAEQGMKPMSNVEEFKASRQEKYQGNLGAIKAGLIQMADFLSLGGYRYAQRKQGMSYEELLKSGTPQTYEVPGEGRVSETYEEQALRKLESPVGTAIGSVGGVAAALWNPLAAGRLLPGAVGAAVAKAVPTSASLASGVGQAVGQAIAPAGATVGKNAIMAAKAATVLSEGAALGLAGAAQEIVGMPDKQYDKMTKGDVAAALAQNAAIGAAISGAFSLVGNLLGAGIGKGKDWLFKRAGTTEKRVGEMIDGAMFSSKSIKGIDDALEGHAALPIWEAVKRDVENGLFAKANRLPLSKRYDQISVLEDKIANAAKITDPAKRQAIIDTAAMEIDKLKPLIAALERDATVKKTLVELGATADDARVAEFLAKHKDSDWAKAWAEVPSDPTATHFKAKAGQGVVFGPQASTKTGVLALSPAERFALDRELQGAMLKATHALSAAVPGANLFGRGLAGVGTGAIGYVASSGDPTTTLITAAIPFAIRHMVVSGLAAKASSAAKGLGELTISQRGANALADGGAYAWKLIGAEAARRADDVVQILTDDEKATVVDRATALSTPSGRRALENGLIQAGMDPESAKAVADTRMGLLGLLIANKGTNRVEFSKLVHAVKSPQGAMGRIAKGMATKQDMTMFKTVFPGAYGSMKMTAKTILGNMSASQKASNVGRELQKMAGAYAPGKISMAGSKALMAKPPKMKTPKAGAAFNSSATSFQKLGSRI